MMLGGPWKLTLLIAVAAGCGVHRHREPPSATDETEPASVQRRERDPFAGSDALPTVSGQPFQSDSSRLQPPASRWPSEAFAIQVEQQLDELKVCLADEDDLRRAAGLSLWADHFSTTEPSTTWDVVYQAPTLRVRRLRKNTDPVTISDPGKAAARFVDLLAVADDDHAALPLTYLKIKVVGVQLDGTVAVTNLRTESYWQQSESAIQKIADWHCQWQLTESIPRLQHAELRSSELVHRDGTAWMTDATGGVLGHTEAFRQQLAYSLQHWLARIETAHGMNYFSKHGLAVADVDGDGLDDLYVCQPGGLPNRLFIQRSDGTATEQAAKFGLDIMDRTASALFVDLDNDGDQDAAVATLMGVLIFENQENQRFVKRQRVPFPDIDLQGISAADYDNDGDLDLYQLVDFASVESRVSQGLPGFIYHDARDGGANRLLQNNVEPGAADWDFTDVTNDVGLNANNQRHSLAASWEDFDRDGDQDLYVANDYGPNCLYENRQGSFVDVANERNAVDYGSGMSVSWSDYDRDGLVDLYVGNMFSSAGSRITTQDEFLTSVSNQDRRLYQRFAKGNTLLKNTGERFVDQSQASGVTMGRWSWSSLFADWNNDGWDDLLVANGYITTSDSGDL